MPTARYTGGGTYRVGGHSFEPGNEIDVDDDLAVYLDSVENFDVDVSDITDEPADDSAGYSIETEDGVNILAKDATVDQIKAAIGSVEDAEAIRYILSEERDGPARKTAIDALEARLAELED